MEMIQFTQDEFKHLYKLVKGILILQKAIFKKGAPNCVELTIRYMMDGENMKEVIWFGNYKIKSLADTGKTSADWCEVDLLSEEQYRVWVHANEDTDVKLSAFGIGKFEFLLEID